MRIVQIMPHYSLALSTAARRRQRARHVAVRSALLTSIKIKRETPFLIRGNFYSDGFLDVVGVGCPADTSNGSRAISKAIAVESPKPFTEVLPCRPRALPCEQHSEVLPTLPLSPTIDAVAANLDKECPAQEMASFSLRLATNALNAAVLQRI